MISNGTQHGSVQEGRDIHNPAFNTVKAAAPVVLAWLSTRWRSSPAWRPNWPRSPGCWLSPRKPQPVGNACGSIEQRQPHLAMILFHAYKAAGLASTPHVFRAG